jgi:DNA polymerase
MFEVAIWGLILGKRYGWPVFPLSKWHCNMVECGAAGLPLSLDAASMALGVAHKDLEGYSLMLKMCRPVRYEDGKPVWIEDPGSFARLAAYCNQDVAVEQAIGERVPRLSAYDREAWLVGETMNMRGVYADRALAKAAISADTELKKEIHGRLMRLTNGVVDSVTRVAELTRWLRVTTGKEIPSLNKDALNAMLLDPEMPPLAKDVLRLRRDAGKASLAKYATLLDYIGPDNRLRGMFQSFGASTARFAGRGPQLQNLPRPEKGFDVEQAATDIRTMTPDALYAKYQDKVFGALSMALRPAFMAGPGRELACGDFSGIEARVVLWLAGDELALHKFRTGVDIYCDMANFITGRTDVKKGDPARALGKEAVLGCGFGMGAVKFHLRCKLNGLDVSEELAKAAVMGYRNKFALVPKLWRGQEAAARNAISTGRPQQCGKVVWRMESVGGSVFLTCILPSGRPMRYYMPSVKEGRIRYWALNSVTKKFEQEETYGGKIVENITQATARDIMVEAMTRIEKHGKYKLVMTIHDELVAEAHKGAANVKEFLDLMCELPKWATGHQSRRKGG